MNIYIYIYISADPSKRQGERAREKVVACPQRLRSAFAGAFCHLPGLCPVLRAFAQNFSSGFRKQR